MDNQQPNQNILELYKQGLSIENICNITEYSYYRVYTTVKNSGLMRKQTTRQLIEQYGFDTLYSELVKKFHDEGKSMDTIANEMGFTSRRTVGRLMKELAIETNRKLTITKEELTELYINKNLSPKEISEIKNTTLGKVNTKIKEYGLKKSEKDIKTAWLRNSTSAFQKKYGNDWPMQNSEHLSKMNKTFQDEYGVDNPFKSEIIKRKIRETNIEKYSVSSYSQTESFRELMIGVRKNQTNYTPKGEELLYNPQKFVEWLYEHRGLYNRTQICQMLNCSMSTIRRVSNEMGIDFKLYLNDEHLSIWEQRFKSVLDSMGLNYHINDRKLLNGLEIDFVLVDHNIGFEINPNYTHSNTEKHYRRYVQDDYHIEKSNNAENLGVPLIHIWEIDFDRLEDIILKAINKEIVWIGDYIDRDKTPKMWIKDYNVQLIDAYYDLEHDKYTLIKPEKYIKTSGFWEVQRL